MEWYRARSASIGWILFPCRGFEPQVNVGVVPAAQNACRGLRMQRIGAPSACGGVTHADDLRPECMWGLRMQEIGVRSTCGGCACRRLECGIHVGVVHEGVVHAGDWS